MEQQPKPSEHVQQQTLHFPFLLAELLGCHPGGTGESHQQRMANKRLPEYLLKRLGDQ